LAEAKPEPSPKKAKYSGDRRREDAIFKVPKNVFCVGSGRTDSGVHSVGQVAHIKLESERFDSNILRNALNSLLPESVRVLRVFSVSPDFHAQRSSLKKQYTYYLQTGPCSLPHLRKITWWIKFPLDLSKMSHSVSALVGRHDFGVFQASDGGMQLTVREIERIELKKVPAVSALLEDVVAVEVVGTGFLKQMVRSIVGTLVQVGNGKLPVHCFNEILSTQNRRLLGPTAPARGLWLEKVWYSWGEENLD